MKKHFVMILVGLCLLSCDKEDGHLKLHLVNNLSDKAVIDVVATSYTVIHASTAFTVEPKTAVDRTFDPVRGEGTFIITYADEIDTVGYYTNGYTTDNYAIEINGDGMKVTSLN